jgi:purine-binding chemotaxis protein CheW
MANDASVLEAGVGVEHLGGKYLTFKLASEVYGLGILKVQEIIGIMAVTHVPKTPDFVRGVINLRGKVIPVIDLRLKFDMDAHETTERTCIIVVQVHREHAALTMGIIVDEVSEVLDVSAGQIEPPPSFGAGVDTEFILGIGKVSEKVIMLLDVDRVLSNDEFSLTAGTRVDEAAV